MTPPKALVFDIQGFSLHDGPGTRTTFFMMGCPLRCRWCANPEGFASRPGLVFRSGQCRVNNGCMACVEACPQKAIQGEVGKSISLEWQKCRICTTCECLSVCAFDALTKCGRWLGISEFERILERDRKFWGSRGGVSFSGGEPMSQPEFLIRALEICRGSHIHSVIETSAFAPPEFFAGILGKTDFAFIDLKTMDSSMHQTMTGVGNELILRNIAASASFGGNLRVVIRVPLISGINDQNENLEATREFLLQNKLREINFLPYHGLGNSKWKSCGLQPSSATFAAPTQERLQEIAALFSGSGIRTYLGHLTPF